MSSHEEIDTEDNVDIYVIGDLHADWNMTLNLFINLELCDNNKKWIAGNKIVVQVGDQVDGKGRGGNPDANGEIEILDFFENMHEQAKAYGGGVYSILGNHEFMNVDNNLSYVSEKDKNIHNRHSLFSTGSTIANKWANTRNVIMRINDIIFVHAGLVPENTNRKNFISKINETARKYLRSEKDRSDEDVEKYLFDYETAPVWNRELGGNVSCSRVNKTLENIKKNSSKKVNHIIVGHSVQNTINSVCDNKIFRVDVGLSKALGQNTPQVLLIKRQNNRNIFKKIS